ncbi:MAG: SHOCT domain-containing protein [Acidobacteria bacterium]|nr:SHOCT domain-containing protein [Acidobacteriota bacterium]MCH7901896.1 SHOCT domain-containing protein [Acidobacteriota bacterium]
MFYGYGWWVIFPIIGLVFMLLMMSRMFGFWGRGPRRGTGMGPMGMMGDDHERHGKPDESALEVLGRRYAGGELTDEEFDAMRQKLEDQT